MARFINANLVARVLLKTLPGPAIADLLNIWLVVDADATFSDLEAGVATSIFDELTRLRPDLIDLAVGREVLAPAGLAADQPIEVPNAPQ